MRAASGCGVVDAGTPCQNSTQLDAQFRVASAPIVAEWDNGGAATSASPAPSRESYLAVGVGMQGGSHRLPCSASSAEERLPLPPTSSPLQRAGRQAVGVLPGRVLDLDDGRRVHDARVQGRPEHRPEHDDPGGVSHVTPAPPPPPWPTMPIVKAKCMLRHEGVHACQQLGAGLWCSEKDAFTGNQACVQSGMDALGCGKGPWDVPSDCNDLNNDKTRDGILLAYMTCRCDGKTQDQCVAACKGDGKKPVRNAYCDQIAATYEPQAKIFPKTQTPE